MNFRQLLGAGLAGGIMLAAAAAHADALRAQALPPALPALPAMTGAKGTVRGDRVNIRARAEAKSEVIGQLNKGDTVEILGRQGEGKNEWLKIALPATAKCYVSAKLITAGAINTDRVNVRSGPGTNFHELGKLAKGENVEVVKKDGEWAQIKPTAACSGWVSAQFVEVLAEPMPTTEVVMPPVMAALPAPPAVQVVDVNPDVLVSYVTKDGILKAVAEPTKSPAAFELMTDEVGGRDYRIAYLESPDKNLAKFVGKHVRVMGNQRWRKGDRDPVIVAERVERVW
jgi:uncharacterized protein YgiM (DUF1202 family)